MIKMNSFYKLNADNVVSSVTWNNGGMNECHASLNEDGTSYTYTSELETDKGPVTAPKPMSLADCLLTANMHLGLIPPQNFNPIACNNSH